MNILNQTMTRRASLNDMMTGLTHWLGGFPKSVIELGLRAGVAAVFFKSGLSKIANWELTVQLFAEEYAVPLLPPELAAYLATAAELACPALLIIGLGARFGALALLGMTAVIQIFVYPESWAEHLLWASIFVYVLTQGAGKLSLDYAIKRVYGRA
ncbi:MAG TPA: DoxX family protein [Gammaproteobacteria bacterium]|nr:DoxX family protein [Gammaproteobacteria bacterium]